MLLRTRAARQAILMNPNSLDWFVEAKGAWYESPTEVKAALRRGRRRARLLRLVRAEMVFSLTPHQRRCVELYYFEGLTYRQVGLVVGSNPSAVHRCVQKAIRKLRAVLNPKEGPAPTWLRRRRPSRGPEARRRG